MRRDWRIGFRGQGMALAMEVMVSIKSGWWIMNDEGSLKVMMMGCDGSECIVGAMMLTVSPASAQ